MAKFDDKFLGLDSDSGPSTDKLSYDDLGNFEHERTKVERKLEDALKTKLRVDYSNFANHAFFNSAESKLTIASNRVLNQYPFDGNNEEKDNFILSGSGYENHILDTWPHFVGYAFLDGTDQYISASDDANKLLIGSSSLCVSAWIKPVVTTENLIIQHISSWWC